MKKVTIQDLNDWGGRRKGAGRPRVPRVTVPLTPELEAALHAQASAAGRTPEQHAAHLIAQGLGVPAAASQPAPVRRSARVKPKAPPAAPRPLPPVVLRQLVSGGVAPGLLSHRELIEDLDDGATLKEQARDVWQFTSASGEVRKVSSRMVLSLFSKGVLKEQL